MKIQTVCGQINAEDLKITLTHEHLHAQIDDLLYSDPPTFLKSYLEGEITLENVGYVRQYPYACKFNVSFNDEQSYNGVVKDLLIFKKLGGTSIVENTCHGLGRDLKKLYNFSKDTGINIIAGTGHYFSLVHSNETLKMSVEQMAQTYTSEILTGVPFESLDNGQTHIKCGFIGEVGSNWPITDFERNAIVAAAEVEQALGVGVSFHPGCNPKAPFEIIRIYTEAGGHPEKCVMSHLDTTLVDDDQLFAFAKCKTYLQYDGFGNESAYMQPHRQWPIISDEQRIQNVLKLIRAGYEDKVLMSHDLHAKHQLITYGGQGYSHIMQNILMRLEIRGASKEIINKITTKNPMQWLKRNL